MRGVRCYSCRVATLAFVVASLRLARPGGPATEGVASMDCLGSLHADAIVVLGRSYRMRPREAAGLYRKGLANKALASRTGSL
jgi:hypothetical protein